MNSDTICAPATTQGGAIGIIRVSGPAAFDVVSSICNVNCAECTANTIHYTHIVHQSQGASPVDEVMLSIFRAPHSYTGEDTVEISCHGSSYIINTILTLLVHQGCRMASPGEFTQRAYLNGKLDLTQAEAVADLIASTNKATHQLAMSQLRGGVSNRLAQLREQLLKLTTLLELELDFSDHEDLVFADRSTLKELAQTIETHIAHLAKSFETGQAIKQGIPVAIIGKTNVGKSTLLNRLLQDDRAIVSDIHGTTRDTIEDTIDIRGIQFRFIDTAGIRNTTDKVEQIGIERTYAAIRKARIVLWIMDAVPTETEQNNITMRTREQTLIPVWNKTDMALPSPDQPFHGFTPIRISAKNGLGMEALEDAIFSAAHLPSFTESDVIITNGRHYEALTKALVSIRRVLEGIDNQLSGDFLAEDLHLTLNYLADITGGQITPQETLSNIFSHFCIGK